MLRRLTLAAWQGRAPRPGGGAAGGPGAAGPVALLAAHGAGGVVAEAPPGLGALQASVLRGALGRAGHRWKGKPGQFCPLSAPVGGGTPGTAATRFLKTACLPQVTESQPQARGGRLFACSSRSEKAGTQRAAPVTVPCKWGIWGLNQEAPASQAQPLPPRAWALHAPGKRRPADPAPGQRARLALPSQGGTGGI